MPPLAQPEEKSRARELGGPNLAGAYATLPVMSNRISATCRAFARLQCFAGDR